MFGIGMGLSHLNTPAINRPVASVPQNVDLQKNTPTDQSIPQNETSVLTSNLMPIGELKGQNITPASNPEHSMEVTNLQSNLAEKITGSSAPYNIITLKDGKQINIDIDTGRLNQVLPGMSEEQIAEVKKKMITGNKDGLTKLLSESESNLPEGMKNINLQFADKPNPFIPYRNNPDINYDTDKKTLNIPTWKINSPKEEFDRDLEDAKDPSLIEQRKKLSELGIKWSDPANLLSAREEVEVMKSLENTASRVPPDKRSNDVPINILQRATVQGALGGITDINAVEGVYDGRTKHISISRFNDKGEPHSLEYLKDTAVHEYGHSVADVNKPDVNRFNEAVTITDSNGKNITDRAVALEENAKKQGHKPDDLTDDRTGTIYDKYDPYVYSEGLKDEKGNVTVEKYARTNEDEHYAETFREYANNPERFRGHIKEMEENLQTLPEHSEEYKYLKESLDIKRESYNYFKTQIFAGHEFGRTKSTTHR